MEEIFMISQLIKQYDEVRKLSTEQGDDYTAGCLLDFVYFRDNYRLIAADFSKQKALDEDPKAIQQIIFLGRAADDLNAFYILEKSKQRKLEFAKGTKKVLNYL